MGWLTYGSNACDGFDVDVPGVELLEAVALDSFVGPKFEPEPKPEPELDFLLLNGKAI